MGLTKDGAIHDEITADTERFRRGLRKAQAEALLEPSSLIRFASVGGLSAAAKIDPQGGMYNAGLIPGVAVLTQGPARTHEMWADREMLNQVAAAISERPDGSKSRFTHPGASGDALGKALGRFTSAKVRSGVVRADMHLYESAHDTPDGDLAGYIMRLATEDPQAFGTSIAFDADAGAENQFRAAHSDQHGQFRSPDKKNVNNYPHVRLARLGAVDFVDDPDANPEGLFHRGDQIVFDADALLAYVFGMTEVTPPEMFGVHPDRIRGFVQKFLSGNNLELHEPPETGEGILAAAHARTVEAVARERYRRAREIELDNE